jgi:DNA-binding protein H-NS
MPTKKSYVQLIKQIEALQLEAEQIRRSEIDGVVERIREAMSHYGLTAADLGLIPAPAAGARRKPAAKLPAKTRRAGKAKGAKSAKPAAVPKFRDEAGNVWVGRGKRPQWLRDALAAGRSLQDFAV